MTGKSRSSLALLFAVLLLALLLRVFAIGHTLMYDEAWNVSTVVDGATGHTGVDEANYFGNFYRHPPLYLGLGIVFAKVTGSDRQTVATALKVISILCSLVLVYAIFLCGRDWFDEWTGLAAAFLFAVMPAARVFDSIVKHESMTMMLCMLFLLYFFRSRYAVAGVFLGLAVLTKEIMIFVPLSLTLFLILTRKWSGIVGLAKSVGVALVMSWWWFIAYSSSVGEFTEFFLGRSVQSQAWRKPWHYYLSRLPQDVGWVALLLLGVSTALLFLRLLASKRDDGDVDREKLDIPSFLLIWIVLVYAVLTVSVGKPLWMIYSALPAAALFGAWGFREAVGYLKTRSSEVLTAVVVAGLAVTLSLTAGYRGYLLRADVMYDIAIEDRRAADYINSRGPKGGGVMMKVGDLSPVFTYYLDCYRPGSMYILRGGEQAPPGAAYTVFLLEGDIAEGEVMEILARSRPGFVLVRIRAGARRPGLALYLSGKQKPARFGDVLIFEVKTLSSSLPRPGTYLNDREPYFRCLCQNV